MKHKLFKRWVAMLLVLAMCVSCVPAAVFAEEGEEETRSQIGTEEQTLEDASAQLGEYTPPAADPEQETEPPAEEPAPETEAPAEATEAPAKATEAPAEPEEPALREGTGYFYPDDMVLTGERIRDGQSQSVEYILIGCWQQLVALDTYPTIRAASSSASATELTEAQRPNVMGPIWRIHEARGGLTDSWTETERELVYPGDANLVGAFANYPLYGLNADTTHPNGKIVDPNGGAANGHSLGETVVTRENGWGTDLERDLYVGGTLTEAAPGVSSYSYPKYALTGDYVIFRSINMADANRDWVPLMFYGTMLGADTNANMSINDLKAAVNRINRSTRSSDYTDSVAQPAISNVTVNQTAELDITVYTGVGFFATISSARPGSASLVDSNVKAEVRNLRLSNISVANQSSGMRNDPSLVSSLTGFLGGTLGVVLDALLTVLLGKQTTFNQSLNALLDARRRDPVNMATGAFAGKVDGDVLIENCDLENVTLSSNYSYVGGFVGHSSGIVQYDGLSVGLGAVLKILTNLLNAIPGVGLGDLITVVKQVLPLNTLIPVGYYNPYITDCEVNTLSGPNGGAIGTMTHSWIGDTAGITVTRDTEYVGGFIGCKIATVMINDSVSNSSYSLRGARYVGGFAGMARDAVIPELLTDLGVDLGLMKQITERLSDANVNLQSIQVRCNLNDDNITVTGTEYLGGFNGAMCDAYCINNEVDCPGNTLTVTGTGDHVGGFAGLATLGYPMSLGGGLNSNDEQNESLLTTLNKVLTSLLSSYGSSLLNLLGVGQSEILGLQFDFGQAETTAGDDTTLSGGEVTVTGSDFVGGLVGKADALILGGATEENLQKITYIRDGDLTVKDLFKDTTGGSSLTVSYLTPEGVTAPASVSKQFGESVTLPADPGSAPAGYNFAGWVTSDYHDTDARPARIFAPGASYVVTRDVTFRALYQKPGQYVYELMTEDPGDDNWEGDYVITYRTGYKEEEDPENPNLRILTGLSSGSTYDNPDSGGATAIEDTAETEENRVVWNNGVLSNVPSLYVFHIDNKSDAHILNAALNTYLRVPVDAVHPGRLTATSGSGLVGSIEWNMVIRNDLKIVLHSDTLHNAAHPYYLTYDETGHYFRTGTQAEADNIYLWRKTLDGPYYDTFTIGTGASINVSGTDYDYVNVRGLKDVSGSKYVGGLVGFADTASVGSLVGDTVGIAKYELFDFSALRINRLEADKSVSSGLLVKSEEYYAGGGIGLAMGGHVRDVIQEQLISVDGGNCAGGFAGCVGPGALVSTGGLEVSLLGLPLISANNLLSLADGLETTMTNVRLIGVTEGYEVNTNGVSEDGPTTIYQAGGFFGRANSAVAEDCHAERVLSVQSTLSFNGIAGGFVGLSEVGGLATMGGTEGAEIKSLLQAGTLLSAVKYLIPEYMNVDVSFVDGGNVSAGFAGGFAGDFESGVVDNSAKSEGNWYAVYNIDNVYGTSYVGGFAGRLRSGALADVAGGGSGGISILGSLGLNIDIDDLVNLVQAYVPQIIKAGVKSDRSTRENKDGLYEGEFYGDYDASLPPSRQQGGFLVKCADFSLHDMHSGAAGGFVGYASGAQISYCDVTQLLHLEVTPPKDEDGNVALDSKDGSIYFNQLVNPEYSVEAPRYAGGFAGFLDTGSSASLGGGLHILGESISLDQALEALNVVVSTVEHSDVYGGPGGFSVLADKDYIYDESDPEAVKPIDTRGLRSGEETLRVFLVDELHKPDIYAWAYGPAGDKYSSWPGERLSSAGTAVSDNGTGFNYYFLDLDPAAHDTVIFNYGQGQHQFDPINVVAEANGANHVVLYLFWNNNASKDDISSAQGDDLWISREVVEEGCRGTYYRYNGLYGSKKDTESNPDDPRSHQFGPWTPYGEDIVPLAHYRSCTECDFTERENCAMENGVCAVCQRGAHEHSFGPWTPVEGVNKHQRVCAECGYVEEGDCEFPGEYHGRNEFCTVCGRYSVLMEGTANYVGRAGGFVGLMNGAQIQDSNSWNFVYVIGRTAAGGYVGEMKPASLAEAVGDTSLLGGLATVKGGLLSVAKDFVPVIRNSETTCIPCGGAVRAEAASDATTLRGMAGGYVGHNCGGQIWGNDLSSWKEDYDHSAANKDENDKIISYAYTGDTRECAAIRILSVYGVEYAGGFTGRMDAGSTADAGSSVSLLFNLVKLGSLLDALKVAYPTEENTAVYGPLYGLDQDTWNAWIDYVGKYGGYGLGMETISGTVSEEEMAELLKPYLYGYHVTAGRDEYENVTNLADSGCAGGYVGAMISGVVTNGQAHNAKQVVAMRSAGGFAGEMKVGSAANLGQVELAQTVKLNLGKLLAGALDVFVPVSKRSSVEGYQAGMTVIACGDPENGCGSAGGYAGSARGAQIWGEPTAVTGENQAQTLTVGEKGCNVYNLKKVQGTRYVGGYIGILVSGTVAEAGTNVSDADSPLQNLLDGVIESGSDNVSNLLGLASATVSTVRYASVDVADPAWGFTVGGFDGKVPLCAGGFIGTMEGAILGNNGKTVTETEGEEGEDDTYTVNDPVNITATNLIVNHLRGVQAQYYAGGFVGVANVGGAASVAGNGASILKLINLDQISALDIFRPYIFNSKVTGVDEGFTVSTMGEEKSGVMCSSRYSGCSGGFAGAVLDGTVKNCQVEDLSQVDALNYAGGFVGHSGKSGLADVDGTQISQLAALNAGVGDSFGTYIKKSSVSGVDHGYTVNAAGGHETVAGGFVGYADLAKIGVKHLIDGDEAESSLACAAENLKFVKSEQIAGGFVGKTTKGYLVELQASSPVVALLLNVVNVLVRALYLPEAERANFLNLNLAGLVGVQLLNEGNLLGVNLLGIRITVALGTKEDEGGATDVAKITIGDSYIELPCNENGLLDLEHSNLTIRLIPLFYTNIKNCTVSAADTAKGYDVFGGGADQEKDGTHRNGYAGGFAGFNHLGKIEGCAAVNCDVVRGTPAKLSETASVSVQKVGPFTGCYYDDSIYNANEQTAKETGDTFNNIQHSQENPPSQHFESDAKVKLMEDTPLPPNLQTLVPETAEMQNPCLPTVDLTLHKVWDDMDGTLGLRADAEHPVTVSFTVTRVAKDKNGNVVTDPENWEDKTVVLTAADANPFTKNVWTKQLTGLKATASVNGEPVYYIYSVTEATVSGYISGTAYADANVAQKLSFYTDKDGGYVAKIVNQFCTDQTVVVDFGLPVNISVIDYLKAKYEYPVSGLELAGILPLEDLQKVSRYDTKDAENKELLAAALDVVNQNGVPTPTAPVSSVQPQYGSFSVPAKENGAAVTKLRYVPGSMMFDKPIQVVAALQGPDGGYYYTKVTVVPATMIYFEDDFISFSSEWTEVGTAADGEQDEDRPGADQLDLNSIYGYDSQYANSSTYSLDSARMVTVTKGMTPSASFTFTGTAFDILAVTDKTTGFMTVEVFRGTTADVQNRVRYWAVDTFYGCTREENGYIRYLCVWDEKELKWRVAKTAFPEMTDAEALAKVGTTEDGCVVKNDYPTDLSTNHSSFIVYKKNYVWVTNGSSNTVYQVPVISTRNGDDPLPYGTYTVVLKPQYASFFDHDTSDASYKVYLDGVRIYGPAENLDAEYYLQDHEGWPQFIEMRKLLLGQEGFGQTQDGEEQSIVYIDGGITVSDLSEFAQYGPNNEIYLDPGQAIAFRLEKGNSAKVDQIHVSMKRVFSGEAKISFTSGTDEAPRSTELTLNTASECYYDLSSVIQWAEGSNQTDLIIISNTGESGTVSLRNLKISYKEAVANENDLVHVVKGTPNTAMEALRLLRRSATLPIVLDEDPAFLGASISLESDFSLHFYIPAAFLADKTNPYVVFTKQTADGPIVICQYDYAEETVGEKLCRRYSFPNLSAAEMGTEVTARLFYNTEGADHMSHALSYSVRQYAMNMLEKTDDAALKTLLVDMLNYGAEAQKYFGVNESSLANSGLTEAQQLYATEAEPALENHKSMLRREDARVWFEGCSLSLERSVTLNYYLDLSTCGIPANELALELSWLADDGSVKTDRIDGTAFLAKQLGNRSLYVAVLDELNAAQMRTVVSAAVIRKEDQMQVSDTMCYSIESYAQSKMKNDPALAVLILAMMKYGDAAESYFSNH